MSRAALIKLLIAQTVLLVLAAWVAAYFARDEFLLATAALGEEEIPGSAPPTTDEGEGVPTVRLSAAAQRQVGIEVAAPEQAQRAGGTELPATVLDVQPLVDLHGRLQAARHEHAATLAAANASEAERRRVQGLFDDDRNASQRALELATAQAAADAARAQAARTALDTLRDQAQAGWGATVAAWLEAPQGADLRALISGRAALLRVPAPADGRRLEGAALTLDASQAGDPASATAAGGKAQRLQPLGAAPAADAQAGGPGRLYRATVAGLAPGTRLTLALADGKPQPGALVPSSALVWHAGQPWVYVRESETEPAEAATPGPAAGAFQRRAVPGARRQGAQWFLPGFEEDDPVVVRGAQVLLSEELKYQIRNENDD